MGMLRISAITCVLYLSIIFVTNGLELADVVEQSCKQSEGFVTQDFSNWISDYTQLFIPMCSLLDCYRLAESFHGTTNLSTLTEDDLAFSCMYVRPQALNFKFTGFCTKTFDKKFKMDVPKVLKAGPDFFEGETSVLRTSLTDGKSWQVMEVCWGDGQRSFAVLSSKPELSDCDTKIITSHLKAIGYDPKFFFTLRYKHCAEMCAEEVPPVPVVFARARNPILSRARI